METKDKTFTVRTYGFSELAQCYNPEICKESAANMLRNWIAGSEELQTKLKEAGYRRGLKILTPRLVKILMEHLGQP